MPGVQNHICLPATFYNGAFKEVNICQVIAKR